MVQHFNLSIKAELTDDKKLETHLEADIQCGETMALAVLTNILRKNEDLKELLYKALIADVKGEYTPRNEHDIEL